jgi:hypothetical protein
MRRPSMGFRKVVGIILIAIGSLLAWGCGPLLAQESSPHWVPFVARLVEERKDDPGRQDGPLIQATVAGVFVRSSRGVSYTRRVVSTRSALPLVGALNTAFLNDRPHQITYLIDFMNKTIRQQSDPPGDPDSAVEPISRADFDKRHAADLSLGKQMVSGVECEGYKLADPRHKGKYRGEAWFAPTLNFLLVRYSARLSFGGTTTTLVKDLEPGKEPDPSLFRLPEGFKLVK